MPTRTAKAARVLALRIAADEPTDGLGLWEGATAKAANRILGVSNGATLHERATRSCRKSGAHYVGV